MNQGNHLNENSKPRVRTNKAAVLIIAVLLLLGAAVGSTVAFLTTKTKPVENSFEYAKVSCEVTGSQEIINTGTTDAYIRATYVVNWLNKDGTIAASVPTGYRYSLTENPDNVWVKGNDGYFYYRTPVAPGNSTGESLLSCTPYYPEGVDPQYILSVEILATAVQSTPAKAVADAWGDGFGIDTNGNLTVPTV